MAPANDLVILDSADKVPLPAPGRHPLTPISGADFDRNPRRRLMPQAWIVISLLVLAPVLWLLWRLDGALRDFFERYPVASDALLWLLLALVGLLLIGLLITLAARAWLSIQHARIVRSRHGVPMDIVAQMRLDPYDLETQAIGLELARAPYLMHPNLSTQSISQVLPKAQDAAPPALPEPGLSAIPDGQWRIWLQDAPHLLISGPTNAGKTTLARALLADASATSDLLILDPHDAVGKWPLPAIGGGRDYHGIYVTIRELLLEMDARFKEYRAGKKDFVTLTCLIDEAPAIALQDVKQWTALMGNLTSEARKVNMRFLVLGQSHLVRDLGISSLVRRNLGLVALGPQALDLVSEEREGRRRALLVELLRGQTRNAAYAYRSEVHVLDVSNVPMLAAKTFTAPAWEPSACLHPYTPDQGDADAMQTDRRTDGGQHDAENLRETLVISLKRARRNREQIRQELQELGMALDNNEYRQILAKHGLS